MSKIKTLLEKNTSAKGGKWSWVEADGRFLGGVFGVLSFHDEEAPGDTPDPLIRVR